MVVADNLRCSRLSHGTFTRGPLTAFHARITAWKAVVAKAHPNVYALIEALRGEELYSFAQKDLISTGSSPPRKRRKYAKYDDRPKRLCDRFEDFMDEEDGERNVCKKGLLGFVRKIAHSAHGVMDFIQEEGEQEQEEEDDEA